MQCTICKDVVEKTEWLPIYLIGSEGTDICEQCKRDLINYLHIKMMEATRGRLQKAKERKGLLK